MRIILSIVGASLPEGAREVGLEDSELVPHEPGSFVEVNRLMESLSQGDRIRFLYPATIEGSQYVSALSSYFAKRGYPSVATEIPGFLCSRTSSTERGLCSLVSLVCGELRAARRERLPVVLYDSGECGTVTAYTSLIGQIFGIPVYSYYQSSLAIPLSPSPNLQSLLYRHEAFFRWLQEERCPTFQVRKRLSHLPASLTALVGSDSHGFTTLSPLGELYFEAYLSQQELCK